MDFSIFLADLGIGIGANIVWDCLKRYIKNTTNPTKEGLKDALISELKIEGADIKAEKIISFLAENGDICISETKIYAKDRIEMGSARNASFSFGNDSISRTDKTSIEAIGKAKIIGKGNTKIVQEDGSMSFYV